MLAWTSEGAGSASKTAVVYFSVPLTDSQTRADSGASIVVSGDDLWENVQYVAQLVAAATGGDLLRIQPQTPYATDDSVFDYALEEQNANARPAISLVAADGSVVDSLDAYDTVCMGYPIWWYELPMPLYTFFENYDLEGKRVAPFVVHSGSGLSGTVQDIEALQPDAQVVQEGLLDQPQRRPRHGRGPGGRVGGAEGCRPSRPWTELRGSVRQQSMCE